MSASVLAPVSEESQAIVAEAFDDADDADSGQQAVLMWPLEELHDLADTDRDLSPLRCSGAEGGDSSEGLSLGGEQTCSAGQNEPGSLALIRQGSQRRSWNRSEDELIRTIVTTNGHRWQQAAGAIPGRSPAAIRNRWTRLQQEAEPEKGVATLTQDDDDRRLWSPALTLRQDSNSSSCSSVSGEDRTKWSADEDATILRCVDDFGKKWRVCAQQLPGRTENAIRNRYHRLLTRANFERGGWHPVLAPPPLSPQPVLPPLTTQSPLLSPQPVLPPANARHLFRSVTPSLLRLAGGGRDDSQKRRGPWQPVDQDRVPHPR